MGIVDYESEGILTDIYTVADTFRVRTIDGDDIDDKYKLVKTLFCDSSGMGSEGEPAYTKSQVEAEVEDLLELYGPLKAGITEAGQFQVYVSFYILKK